MAFHEPYYTTQGPGSLATFLQGNVEDLFYQYGVDIVITGHVHSYERTFPVYKGAVSALRRTLSAESADADVELSRCPEPSTKPNVVHTRFRVKRSMTSCDCGTTLCTFGLHV